MKNICIDAKKTLGITLFMGAVEKAVYVNKVKTGEIEGYTYKLGSYMQGTEVAVFVPGELRSFEFGQNVEVVNAVLNVSAQASNNFATTRFSMRAEDIRLVSTEQNANTGKKDDFSKKEDKKVAAL